MGLTRIRADQISDIDYKQATRVITLTNITLSGGAPATVDGVSLQLLDRILVAGQSDGAQNGLYKVTTVGTGSNGTWARTNDGNETGEIQAGMIVMVTEGVIYKDTQWKLTTNDPIVIGTTALVFEQNSAYAFGNIYANSTAVLANSVGDTLTLTAGDNIAIVGNASAKSVTIGVTGISLTSIANGDSNVNVVSSGGNVTVGVGGTNNIAVFSTGGANVTGYVTATGNVTGGNLSTAGRLGVGTASPDYQVDITNTGQNALLVLRRTDGVGTFIEGQATRGAFGTIGADPLVLAYNSLAVISIGAGGAITVNPDGGSPFTFPTADGSANNILATDGAGNVDWTGTPTFTSMSATGNVTGGNLTTAGDVTTSTVTASGNVVGGNLNTAGQVVATGNITGGNIKTSVVTIGSTGAISGVTTISASGNANVGNIGAAAGVFTSEVSSSTSITATGNITGGNLVTTGQIVATGNITGGNILGNGAGLSGLNIFSTVNADNTANITASGVSDTLILEAGAGIAISGSSGNVIIALSAAENFFATGGDMGSVADPVTETADAGFIIDTPPTDEYDWGAIAVTGVFYPELLVLPPYTVSTLPTTVPIGAMIYVTDASGGAVPAFGDGVNWRRVTDRAVVT